MKIYWWIKLILILMVFRIAGCSSLQPQHYIYTRHPIIPQIAWRIPIFVDRDFGPLDKGEIIAAVDQWNYALNGNLNLEVVDLDFGMENSSMQTAYSQHGFMVMKIDALPGTYLSEMEIGGKKSLSSILGFVDRIEGNVIYLINNRLSTMDVKYVMMHEIGHILGARHGDGRLMDPFYYNNYECIDQKTALKIAARWHLSSHHINWCYPVYD